MKQTRYSFDDNVVKICSEAFARIDRVYKFP